MADDFERDYSAESGAGDLDELLIFGNPETRRTHQAGRRGKRAGLDLGAETPEEIGLTIVSEIQRVFGHGSGESLREAKMSIHAKTESQANPAVIPSEAEESRSKVSGAFTGSFDSAALRSG